MPLQSGTKLGQYEILAKIGAGGMGEVYKAKDTRLDHTVAIKVLPSHLSDNAPLKERFEREARAVSRYELQIPAYRFKSRFRGIRPKRSSINLRPEQRGYS